MTTLIRAITEADFTPVAYVAENMRERDKEEVYATHRENSDPYKLADDCLRVVGQKYIAFRDGEPVSVFGAARQWQGVYSMFMFATDQFPKVGKGVTSFARRVIIPTLVREGFHRAHCFSLDGYTEIHEWIESIGAVKETVLRQYGRNKEDFAVFVWSQKSCASLAAATAHHKTIPQN